MCHRRSECGNQEAVLSRVIRDLWVDSGGSEMRQWIVPNCVKC